jgi:hypothetical protein
MHLGFGTRWVAYPRLRTHARPTVHHCAAALPVPPTHLDHVMLQVHSAVGAKVGQDVTSLTVQGYKTQVVSAGHRNVLAANPGTITAQMHAPWHW